MADAAAGASGKRILEICVDDAAGLVSAIRGGADRIELCSALSVGGLTPTAGFMALAAQAPIPVNALIRPRAGGFHYGAAEVEMMRRDVAAAREAGLAGVVIGALEPNGRLDTEALRVLIGEAQSMDLTLHRAFDLTPDLLEALETAIALGFRRILTSGGQKSVAEGKEMVAALTSVAAGRISIMPGGGVTAELAPYLLSLPHLHEIHASGTQLNQSADNRLIEFGFLASGSRETNESKVRGLKAAISG